MDEVRYIQESARHIPGRAAGCRLVPPACQGIFGPAEGELAAAQQIQQVLVPEAMESVPEFLVESVYQPAQQVGCDFFQVLPVMSGIIYDTTPFLVNLCSRLTFYSDGVVEAQNPKGEVLGFDRARELSTLPAADIVKAAELFGQEDDITVVTIERRTPIAAEA